MKTFNLIYFPFSSQPSAFGGADLFRSNSPKAKEPGTVKIRSMQTHTVGIGFHPHAAMLKLLLQICRSW